MKVSLITATYNSERTIKTCLESVANQSYPNIEHLVIDGKSLDDTIKIVNDHSKQRGNVRLVSEPDEGIYDALNKGIKQATGDIIGFVHSDDILSSEETINNIVKEFKEQQVDGVYGDLKYVDSIDITKIKRYWRSSRFTASKLKNGWMPPHPTLYLRKDVYNVNGLFDANLKIAADYEFILRIFKKSELSFSYIPKVFVLMRTGGESNKTLGNIISKSKEDYYALRTNKIKFPLLALFKKNAQKIPQWLLK